MKTKMPKYVDRFTDRLGKARYYYRRKCGPRVALPGLPWSPEFMAAYKLAETGQGAAAPRGTHAILPGSVEAALVRYYGSDMWQEQAKSTRDLRRPILEQFRVKYGTGKIRALQRNHVQQIIAARSASAQSNWMKCLRHFMTWAIRENLIATNPCNDVAQKKKAVTGGFPPWTEADVIAYRDKYAIGTQARLTMELMLNLGVRVSDARQIGQPHIQNGVLTDYQPQKGRTTGGHFINVPVHADLARTIKGTKVTGAATFLVTGEGNIYTAKYLGQKMREWCDDAGLPECSSHGLRKLCLTRLAEAGCSPFEIMAISGHKNLKEVTIYTEAANRKKLALLAMAKLAGVALNAALPLDKLREAYADATGTQPTMAEAGA
ncbi:site-specific integrase [Bradyrhizobium japonicum]|uniref:tyrosine-type recombinase/integrase n=1 Tax=Bradyrhizobium japonicum TaxID=375 RepID=UPI00200C5ACB|nr:site-specific integrase [Bradyrhizobium japonicum]UQD70501.1 site-specific integrase [Bradyrhizobium japonicum]